MKKIIILTTVLMLFSGLAWGRTFVPHSQHKLLRISPRSKAKQEVIVRFKSMRAMKSLDLKIPGKDKKKYRRFPLMSAKLSGKEAARLSKHPGVLSIETNADFILHDWNWSIYHNYPRKVRKGRFYDIGAGPDDSWGVIPQREYQSYGLGLMQVTRDFHAQGHTGYGIKVGIIDTGIDTGHPDLHVTGGWNFYNDSIMFGDVLGHGTHVAGIIGARKNGYGVVGIAPQADIYSLRAFDIFGRAPLSAILNCIQWAIDHDLDILNMSFGGGGYSPAMKEALQLAHESGVLLIASAGNSGPSEDSVTYPAAYETVVAVSAINENSEIADFSSRGPEVEVTAPGVEILSTFTFPPHYEHFYDLLSGTSMACPHVVGMAALIKSANPGMDNEELRQRLSQFSRDLGPDGRDIEYGHGLPLPDRSFMADNPGNMNSPQAEANGPYLGIVGEPVSFTVKDTQDQDDNFLDYTWDYGDSTIGKGKNPQHTYASPGRYSAKLTAQDQGGATGSDQAEVIIGAGVDKSEILKASDQGFVKASSYASEVNLGRSVVAGKFSAYSYIGIMNFQTPESDDVRVISAELLLDCTVRSPKDEGTITAGLLKGLNWPPSSYDQVEQAPVIPLDSPIVMSYLHTKVKEGATHRFSIPKEHLAYFQEQFNQGSVAFRIRLSSELSTNTVSWTNPRIKVRYLDGVSTEGSDISQENMAPVANAGYDRRVEAGSMVFLNGSRSRDYEGAELDYQWRKISPETAAIDLQNAQSSTARFQAPEGLAEPLVFELTVDDGKHQDSDRVKIYPGQVPADIHDAVITPDSGKAGYVEEDHPQLNFFRKRVIYSGVLSRWKTDETTTTHGQAVHVGAVQFDLDGIPPGMQIVSAHLELTGTKNRPDNRTSYDVVVLDKSVDDKWQNLDYQSLTQAKSTALLETLTAYQLDTDKVNKISVSPSLLEKRRQSTDKVTFRIDGPTLLYGSAWEWYAWWSGNEAQTADKGPRLVVQYGAMEPVDISQPEENHPPVLSIDQAPSSGQPEDLIGFTFTATDQDRDEVTLSIDWGDGTSITRELGPGGQSTSAHHSWTAEGSYTIRIAAEDEPGARVEQQTSIDIGAGQAGNEPPSVTLGQNPEQGIAGEELDFTFEISDPDGDNIKLDIDWGDGEVFSTGFREPGSVSASYTWPEEKIYQVQVTARDQNGASSRVTFEVNIQPPPGQELVISENPSGTWYLGTSYTRRIQGQTFQALGSEISSASVALSKIGNPQEPIEVSIRRRLDSGVYASAQIEPSQITSTDRYEPGWITVNFDDPAQVQEGSKYFLVLEVMWPDRNNYYRVGYDSSDPYPDGAWYPDATYADDYWGQELADMACTVTFR